MEHLRKTVREAAGVYSGNKKMRGAAAEMCGQRPDEVDFRFCRHRQRVSM